MRVSRVWDSSRERFIVPSLLKLGLGLAIERLYVSELPPASYLVIPHISVDVPRDHHRVSQIPISLLL